MAMEIAKAFASAVAAVFALSLAAGDRPEAPSARVGIVIARNPERSQRIAAEEFAKMHEKVTGYRPTIATEAAGRGPFVFIGIPDADMAFEGECDSYYIRSKGANLTIAGKNVRSTLYGVFDFFRRRAGAAYFWDGDVFERRAALDFSNLDVFERSRFEYRACQYFAHRGLTRFNAEHWGFEDWKREIDWAVKNRLNVIRLCLGIEDIFQRAFPEVVPYPDPSKTQATDSEESGYDLRSPFWSLEYRSLLRRSIFNYALERGLMMPVEFGPQTHWYSRTPREFLDAYKPEFMPQIDERYSQPSGLMWDCRRQEWFDKYWQLAEASISTYGYSGLLFNPGFDERTVCSNREDNVKLKIEMLRKFNDEAARRYPDAKLLMEGWDFYLCWTPEEMRRLTAALDPENTIIWDFMADANGMRGYPWIPTDNNFTQWGVTNRFPYVFGYTLAHERGLDVRCNYAKIREREAAIVNDPMCKGYCIWPENSHTDIFAWRYFTDNCWKLSGKSIGELLAAFCRDRYRDEADGMRRAWELVIPDSTAVNWTGNCLSTVIAAYGWGRNQISRWKGAREPDAKMSGEEVFAVLSSLKWTDARVRRDSLDLARTVLDRKISAAFEERMKGYHDLKRGKGDVASVAGPARRSVALMESLAEVLSLHGDYSLAESLDRLDSVERIRNRDFERVLFENSSCGYCRSHQYEYAAGWYVPHIREVASTLCARAERGDFSPLPPATDFCAKMRALAHPIREFAPDPKSRTEARYREVMNRALNALGKR